jgi:N-acetyl-alpha-D-muramate 1-phosphate uridylyltransferase
MLPVAILAGGLATRLHPVTLKMPKSLNEIAGEPFLAHQLRWIRSQGVRSVVLCLGYLGEQIEAFAHNGNAFDLNIAYSWDGARLRGTAGALKNALPLLRNEFFVMYGDSYLPCCFAQVQDAFFASGKQGLMTVFRNCNQWDRSNVEFFHREIRSYSKRNRTAQMQHIDYGLGVLRADALNRIRDDGFWDLSKLYELMLRDRELAAFEVSERFYEIGSFAGIEELSRLLTRDQREP